MFDNSVFLDYVEVFLWEIYVDFIDTEIYKHCSCFIFNYKCI